MEREPSDVGILARPSQRDIRGCALIRFFLFSSWIHMCMDEKEFDSRSGVNPKSSDIVVPVPIAS
jgi:hypothetical protein